MWPKEIVEKFEQDHAVALASGEERSCGQKIKYDTPLKATKAAYNLEVKSPGETLEPYHCPWCSFYHIGHPVDNKCERAKCTHEGFTSLDKDI
jgi:hypothetical protein